MIENKEETQKLIQENILIPAEQWDLFINGNGKDPMINIGLRVYIQSFHTDEYESHQLSRDHQVHAIGKLTARLLPWFEEKRIWIHKSEREVTLSNNPEIKKKKKQYEKVAKTGIFIGEVKPSII